MTAPRRALLGFAAGVLSVLSFHQGMWAILHAAGLMPPAPYPTDPVPPLGVPRIANFCFWGGLYGAAFGLALPRLPRAPLWLWGSGSACSLSWSSGSSWRRSRASRWRAGSCPCECWSRS